MSEEESELVRIVRQNERLRVRLANLERVSFALLGSGVIHAGEKSWQEAGRPQDAVVNEWKKVLAET